VKSAVLILLVLPFLIRCQDKQSVSSMHSSPVPVTSSSEENFDDLKPKTGGCTTEEDIKKKLEEAEKAKTFKLQGNDSTDCTVQ